MSWERVPMSWERDKYFFTCPLSAAVEALYIVLQNLACFVILHVLFLSYADYKTHTLKIGTV